MRVDILRPCVVALRRIWVQRQGLLETTLSYLAVAAAIASVGAVDVITGAEIHVVSLYFVPLAFAGWRLGAIGASIASVLSTIVWLAALYEDGTRYKNHAIWAVNFITQLAAFLTVSLLVATLSKKLRQEKVLRRTDPLTGLSNRQAFIDQAGAALAVCRRYRHPTALAFIDLDNFKRANDEFGHAYGDQLLRECGAILLASVRTSDVAARLGGDEFVLFLPEASIEAAMAVVARVVAALDARPEFLAAAVTASVGLVVDDSSMSGIAELLALADAQMYEAKQRGKNGIRHARLC